MANDKTSKKENKIILNLQKIVKKKKFQKIALITGLTLFVLGLLIFIFNFSYRDKILPQTYIGGVNVGGMSLKGATDKIRDNQAQTKKDQIDLSYQENTYTIKTADLEVNIKPEDSAFLAWQIGRNGSFSKIIVEQLKSVFIGNHKLAVFTLNVSKLNQSILDISNKIDIPEKDATIKIENFEPIVVNEQTGKKLDFTDTENKILNTIGNFKKTENINLKVETINPKVTKDNVNEAFKQTSLIIKNTINLKSNSKNYTLSPSDFAPWLVFQATLNNTDSAVVDLKNPDKNKNKSNWVLGVAVDQSRVGAYLNGIAGEINQDPKDAKFQVENGQVTTFQTSQTGYKLDTEKGNTEIASAILNLTVEVNLPVTVINPEVSSDSATAMGLKELVGSGQTSWRGSPANRIHNLTLGAKNISGTIVKPGEEFSTVKAIGPIDGSHGFLPELVIKNSTQVVPEFGGGLCQVSTTLFRAALNSGLKITARTNHSFRVSYYEPPVGMDATIYDPAPDFKFVNTYKTPILIWGIAGNNGLEFQIYGTKDGRVIDITTPVISNYIDPPADSYQESATMEPGTIRQVERALRGCIASFHYKVTEVSGNVLENETFVSKYVALANSYLYGAGYVPPASQ
jgi:vancomycin resistance protein YoaR